MLKTNYNLTIGKWLVNSANDLRTEFIELETSLSLDTPNDCCHISVYAPPAQQPGLPEQTAGAATSSLGFSDEEKKTFLAQIRGNDIKRGDQITIELASGDVTDKVMTGQVDSINSSFGQTEITGRTGMHRLTNTRLNQVYENQSLKQIVKDLSSQAGFDTGEIETGSAYPYYIVHESKNLLKHIQELAIRDGMDFYFDRDNKLTLKKFNKTSADHTFYYGIDILDLQLVNCQTINDHILVYGESPVSNQGQDAWHWLAKDISPFKGEAGEGAKTLALQDSSLRTKDAADSLATSKFGAIKDHSTWGRLKLLGNPKVKLADAVEIKNAEKPELNGLFKVTSVRHVFNKQEGYLTYVGFTGQGGAKEAGSLFKGAIEL